MRTALIAILFLASAEASFGQRKSDGPPRMMTKQEYIVEERNHDCVRHTFKPLSARLKYYPFNEATQIQLVAFTGLEPAEPGDSEYVDKGLPMAGDSIVYAKLTETRTLTFSEVDTLTDIFYNYGYAGPVRLGSEPLCYEPRNAILFIDKKNKVFAFIEICFLCGKTRESSEKISLGQMCNEKIEMIKRFFKNVGIEYGVTKGPMIDQN